MTVRTTILFISLFVSLQGKAQKIFLDTLVSQIIENNGLTESIKKYANHGDTIPVLVPDSLAGIFAFENPSIKNIHFVFVTNPTDLYRFRDRKRKSNLLLFLRIEHKTNSYSIKLGGMHLSKRLKRKNTIGVLTYGEYLIQK